MRSKGLLVFNRENTSDKKFFTEMAEFLLYKTKLWHKQKINPVHNANYGIWFIRIPYSVEEIPKLKKWQLKQLNESLKHTVGSLQIGQLYCPSGLSSFIIDTVNSDLLGEFEDLIFKSLIPDLIELVYKKNNKELYDLDIAIVIKDISKLNLISYISEKVKYLTIIYDKKDEIEKFTEEIYQEQGTAIGITDDLINGLKRRDIIINFSNLNLSIGELNKQKSVIMNFGTLSDNTLNSSLVISGIDVNIPAEIKENISSADTGISNFRLAALVISMSTQFKNDKVSNSKDFLKIRENFYKSGFKITAVKSRRNIQKIVDIKI